MYPSSYFVAFWVWVQRSATISICFARKSEPCPAEDASVEDMKLQWIVTVCPTCGAKSSDPVNQIALWCLPSNMYLSFLDLRQPLIILSPLFAELAIEPGCESCCIEGAECSLEAGGACCVPCAIDAALNRRQVTSIGRIFFMSILLREAIGVA